MIAANNDFGSIKSGHKRCYVCGKFIKFLEGENFGISVLVGTKIKKAHIGCAKKNKLNWFNM